VFHIYFTYIDDARSSTNHVYFYLNLMVISLLYGSTAPLCLRPPHFRITEITLLRHTHSVGVVWMTDQPVAATSTWQHTPLTRDRYPRPGGIRTNSPSKRTAAFPRLRSRGQLDCLVTYLQFRRIKSCNILAALKRIYVVLW
jgi:hypothetical protein